MILEEYMSKNPAYFEENYIFVSIR